MLPRSHDAPAYTLSPFLPPDCRTPYLVLRAFNLELARIPDSVSTTQIAALRYQFWRDNITAAFDATPRKQPVSILLARVLEVLNARGVHLSKTQFMRVISAREKYGDGRPYASLTDLENYAESTYSTLMYLTLQALPMHSVTADHIASHIGRAAGIVATLRGLPFLAFPPPPNHHSNSAPLGGSPQRTKQGTVMLPLDVMARAGVKEEEVLREGGEAKGLKDAVFEVATRANDHLITAREMMKNVRGGQEVGHEYEYAAAREGEEQTSANDSEEAAHFLGKEQRQLQEVESSFGIFMEAVAAQSWLNRLQKADFDLFSKDMRRKDWKLVFKAYGAWRRRAF